MAMNYKKGRTHSPVPLPKDILQYLLINKAELKSTVIAERTGLDRGTILKILDRGSGRQNSISKITSFVEKHKEKAEQRKRKIYWDEKYFITK